MRSNLSVLFVSLAFIIAVFAMISCSEEHEHMAPAIRDRDSVPVMTTYGVNTLISDSGVIKYRIVTEQWEVNENKKPSRWTFNKGILLTQFNLKKHVVGYIQCDTAVYYDQDRRWELHGHVKILTAQVEQKSIERNRCKLVGNHQPHRIGFCTAHLVQIA